MPERAARRLEGRLKKELWKVALEPDIRSGKTVGYHDLPALRVLSKTVSDSLRTKVVPR